MRACQENPVSARSLADSAFIGAAADPDWVRWFRGKRAGGQGEMSNVKGVLPSAQSLLLARP